MNTNYRQRGVTFTSIIMGTLLFVFAFWVGMRIVPPLYLHLKVQKVLESIAAEERYQNTDEYEIKKAFEARLSTSYIEGLTAEDLKISPTNEGRILSVTIDKENPLFEGVAIHVLKEASVTLRN